MTDAELQALWDKNLNAPPPKRMSEEEFFKTYMKNGEPEEKRSGGGFGPGVGALALGL